MVSSPVQPVGNQPAAVAKPVVRSFAEFLESTPPDTTETVTGLWEYNPLGHSVLHTPEITLHCDNERCNGLRVFHTKSGWIYLTTDFEYVFVTYECRNCAKSWKTFSLRVLKSINRVYKLGEFPPFGPPTPSRLISLVGSDRELFLKGRRAELRGLGIGAFAYYRRVVEDKKGAIVEEIGKVAKRLGASPETLALFAEAQAEIQFSNAIDKIKAAIPQSLLINGHNPLILLHSALSKGIHAGTDEECLELATSIRLILMELAERIATALKDEAELRDAVSRLLNK
jgi:hypothetical protein